MKKKPDLTSEMIDPNAKSHAMHTNSQINGETQQTQAGKILKVSARRHQK
ncbi:YpzG family protein [Sporolactobacillus pectinivorans]|nr:YpzG family protein [Sporolactobacillus pectinivorans]